MYICICKAVTDHEIRECAENGACSLRDLERRLGVGTGCGKCRESVAALLENVSPASSIGVAQVA